MKIGKNMLGIALAATLIALTGCASGNPSPDATRQAAATQQTAVTQAAEQAEKAPTGQDLVIPIADITQDAGFYPVNVDGTEMEVIAVRAPDGTIRTAFNTCQVCYGSGRGYYVQQGDKLVCQNCGNHFSMSQVEVVSGGCNPWPILDADKSVDDTDITIPYSFLKDSASLFENWKTAKY
jgi:uncharacterized membrane protein